MLSDGFGSTGLASFVQQLMRAEDARVEVFGLGVGMDGSNVRQSYSKWVVAKLPQALPSALRQLYEGGGDDSVDAEEDERERRELRQQLLGQDGNDAFKREESLRQAEEKFRALSKSLNENRTATIQQGESSGSLMVDIVIVIDATGSMRQRLPQLVQQFAAMLVGDDSLTAKVSNELGVDLLLRCAVLGFRDRDDGRDQFFSPLNSASQDVFFGPDAKEVEELVQKMNAELQGRGGHDTCEDVPAALKKAVEWDDWQGQARYLLLLTDAPCHGSDFNGGEPDNHPGDSASSRAELTSAFQSAAEKSISVIHCALASSKTHKMYVEMAAAAKEGESTHGIGKRLDKDSPGNKNRDAAVANAAQMRLTQIDLGGGGAAAVAAKTHLVFCMDESSSMRGTPWSQLNQAYKKVWMYFENGQGAGEVVSVVQYSGSARVTLQYGTFQGGARDLQQGGGGTAFSPAAEQAVGLIKSQPAGCTPVVIFMSDGQTNDGEQAKSVLGRVPGLQVHTVAFGSGASTDVLRNMASKPEYFHTALDGAELVKEFLNIAQMVSNSQLSDKLYEDVGTKLALQMQTKLMTDCL